MLARTRPICPALSAGAGAFVVNGFAALTCSARKWLEPANMVTAAIAIADTQTAGIKNLWFDGLDTTILLE
jgi:hypothetical protein